jgi:regulator of replication initiation timing
MDLVMERAARMGMATPDEMRHEESLKKGMQLTAEYLNGGKATLVEILREQDSSQQESVRKGMLASLLRNLFLPRDEDGVKRIEQAVKGVVELNQGTPDIAALCQELQTIASQYGQHRKQLYEQLKEQMRMQIEQMLLRKGMKADSMKIDPTMEPQFKEQWSRLEADIDAQYGQAMEQFKAQLKDWTGA